MSVRYGLIFIFALWVLAICQEVLTGPNAQKPAGPVFYVATNGSDRNPGSETSPWQTIQHAADAATPGSAVLVRGGIYAERVVIRVSGNAAQGYITFQSHPGEIAILDGERLIPPDERTAMVSIHDRSYVRIRGFEIRNYRTSERRATPAGIFVSGAGSHIELLGNNVHNIEQNWQEKGGNAFGIAVYGTNEQTPISKLVIDGNEVHHLKTGSSESVVVNGNVTDFRISHNVVHDNNNIGIDVIGHERTAADPNTDRARDGEVSQNRVYSITSKGNPSYGDEQNSDGIYVDGGMRVLIEQNVIHDVDFGIELASEHKGKTTSYVTARNNLIYFCHNAGISIGGYDSERGITEHCLIVNNTLYKNDTGGWNAGEFQMQFYMANNVFKNNILVAGPEGLFTVSKSGRMSNKTPTVELDYNLYFLASGSKVGRWQYDTSSYTGFNEYVKATGNDRHSRFADPLFINPTEHDFHLKPGSPAIDSGVVLDRTIVGLVDLDGAQRNSGGKIDMGCYEREPMER